MDEFDLVWLDFVFDFVNINFLGVYIVVSGVEIFYLGQCEFFKVVVFYVRRNKRYGNVFLYMVDVCLWRDQGYNFCDEVNEIIGGVILVVFCMLQFVQFSFFNDECWVNFKVVGLESWIFKVFLELIYVVFYVDIGKIGYYMVYNFEFSIFG